MRKFFVLLAAAGLAAAAALPVSAAGTINGAGASFVFPAMAKWSAEYNRATEAKVNYQSIGSGGGIAQAKAGTVDFGSSDAPLPPEELAASSLGQFPSVIGGVVPVVNVPGLKPGELRLTGALLADIYLGKITQWNDPALVALNPSLTLPDMAIRQVYRSDGSGTTFNFVNYLSKVSPEWKGKVGEGTSVRWPGGIGGRGNEGVAAFVKQIRGGIGYVELSYALTNNLTFASMQNAAGNWVQPSIASFSAAAESADWTTTQDFYLVITDAPGADAWPITATNFILMPTSPRKPESAKAALEFFRWVYANMGEESTALGYVPLPKALTDQVEAYWAKKFVF